MDVGTHSGTGVILGSGAVAGGDVAVNKSERFAPLHRSAPLAQVRWYEQCLSDVRTESDWLSHAEVVRLEAARIPKRRNDLRLGRWTAKRAVAAYLNLPSDRATLAAIELRPDASGAPSVFVADRPAPVAISLSHRAARAVCAVAAPGALLGCDLEIAELRWNAFVTDYFTAEEQVLIARVAASQRWAVLALLWSAKESTLKALRVGLRVDTRQVVVESVGGLMKAANHVTRQFGSASSLETWHRLRTRFEQRTFHGWWQSRGIFVRTMVSEPELGPPIPLRLIENSE